MFYYADKVYDEEGDIIKWTFNEAVVRGGNHCTRVDVYND